MSKALLRRNSSKQGLQNLMRCVRSLLLLCVAFSHSAQVNVHTHAHTHTNLSPCFVYVCDLLAALDGEQGIMGVLGQGRFWGICCETVL